MSIFSTFSDEDIVPANPTIVTTGLWSNDSGSFESALYLNQTQQLDISGEYYFDVYDQDPELDPLAEVQFAIAYGHINGGGAPTLVENEQGTLPTTAIYSQYRNLLLDSSDTRFSFNGVDSDHIYVINFQRARIREQLDPGNWELPLSGGNGLFTFIDDSNQTLGALTANSKAGRVFNVVSGSLTGPSGSTVVSQSFNGIGFGLVYPDLGIIVLNPDAICPTVGFLTSASALPNISGSAATSNVTTPFYTLNALENLVVTTSLAYAPVTHSLSETTWTGKKSAYNQAGLYVALNKGVNAQSYAKGFLARSAETISSTHYFVRLRNKEFNYSNNPTFYNPNNGALIRPEFAKDPRVYITTVGLYDSQNQLLAVAKLSKPVRKSFDEEVLLRVRLDY